MKDYYLILQVNSEATPGEIRAAYRRLAKELHPDHYEGGSQPFQALQEAYATLSNPERRRAYDRSLRAGHSRAAVYRAQAEPLRPSSPAPEPLELGQLSSTSSFHSYSPSFEEIFDRLWQNFGLIRSKIDDLRSRNVLVNITPLQAFNGGRVQLMIPARLVCPTCAGHSGVGWFECLHCGGVGVVEGGYPVTVKFPPGTPNNYAVEIPLDRLGIRNFYLTVIFKVSERW